MTDWRRWHEDYDDPTSRLAERLAVVQSAICDWLDTAAPGPLRLLSACAGQGHDVIGALRHHPRRSAVSGLLVEIDDVNASAARFGLDEAGLPGLVVRCADAGRSDAYADWVPADLLMLCGVFGNISDDDVRRTIGCAPMLCAPGATVLWTRHRRPPDRTPAIRGWFAEAGFDEVGFIAPDDGLWSVGIHRLRVQPRAFVDGVRMFAFTR